MKFRAQNHKLLRNLKYVKGNINNYKIGSIVEINTPSGVRYAKIIQHPQNPNSRSLRFVSQSGGRVDVDKQIDKIKSYLKRRKILPAKPVTLSIDEIIKRNSDEDGVFKPSFANKSLAQLKVGDIQWDATKYKCGFGLVLEDNLGNKYISENTEQIWNHLTPEDFGLYEFLYNNPIRKDIYKTCNVH